MPEVKYPQGNTRQIMDYNRFIELTGEKQLVCLDKGVMEIAKYLLGSRGLWPTSYATAWGEYSYTTPTEEEMKVIRNAIAEANIDMASCDDIVQAINDLGQMIASNQCCSTGQGANGGGTGGTGTDQQGINPWEPAEPNDFPPNFPSLAEYKSHKCASAGKFMAGLIDDLNAAGILSLGALTILGIGTLLLAAFITPVPWDDLLVIAGVFAFVAGIQAACTDLATYVYNNQDELLCELYNGDSATASKASAIAWLVDAIESFGYSEPIESGMITIVNSLVTNDAINRLFDNNPLWEAPGFDCSACEPDTGEYTVNEGTEESAHPSNPVELTTEFDGGCHIIDFSFDDIVTFTSVEWVTTQPGKCGGNFYFNYYILAFYDPNESPDESMDTLPQDIGGGVTGYRRLRFACNTESTIRITYST